MAIYLKNIKFPVYPLSNNVTVSRDDDIIYANGTKKIDDKSLKYDSLGKRRLHIENPYPLKKAIQDIGTFFLYTKLYRQFIDSNGKLFKYEARTKVPLIYRKILDKVPYKSGCMLKINTVHCPVYCYKPIDKVKEYAALLYIEKGYVLLGDTDKPSKRISYKI